MSSKDVIIEPKEEEKVEYHLLSVDETKTLLHTGKYYTLLLMNWLKKIWNTTRKKKIK